MIDIEEDPRFEASEKTNVVTEYSYERSSCLGLSFW